MSRTVTRNRTLVMEAASLEAKRRLELQKIEMPMRPDDGYPDLPDDPTDLTDSGLLRAMTKFTRWAEYLGAQLACAEVDESYAEEYLARVKAIRNLSNSTEKTVTLMKARAYEDPEYVAAHEKFQQAYAYRKLIQVKFQACERNGALLSRELTRRVGRDSREGRVERYQA